MPGRIPRKKVQKIKKTKNQKLDKSDQEFYKQNKHLVDFKRRYSEQDENIIKQWV